MNNEDTGKLASLRSVPALESLRERQKLQAIREGIIRDLESLLNDPTVPEEFKAAVQSTMEEKKC